MRAAALLVCAPLLLPATAAAELRRTIAGVLEVYDMGRHWTASDAVTPSPVLRQQSLPVAYCNWIRLVEAGGGPAAEPGQLVVLRYRGQATRAGTEHIVSGLTQWREHRFTAGSASPGLEAAIAGVRAGSILRLVARAEAVPELAAPLDVAPASEVQLHLDLELLAIR